jgi:predicted acylesterase/phospholipase RssA
MTAPDVEPVTDRNREELRLALAMRGGVSLAVWIGGAVSEIERMRRDSHPTYQALLNLAGYRPQVIVDVLTGASAGGLNGAVYAACQVYGIDIARLRDLWIRIGDIEALSRATTSGHRAEDDARRGSAPVSDARDARSRARRPPSLMDGDGYFYVQLRDELHRLYSDRGGAQGVPIAERIELVLTATLFEPVRTSVRLNRSTTIEDQRSSAQFRFRHGLVRTDFHPTDEGERETALARLAMAARTTSSFPFAFEPASIAVGLPAQRRDDVVDALDFTGTFEAPRPPGRPAPQAVIDGGVLDNIPVTAAIRAVAAAPADGPTARRLVYMHPSPPAMSQSGGDTTQLDAEPAPSPRVGPRPASTLGERIAGLGSPRAIKAGIRTLGARFGQESLLADIDELALVNDIAERRRLALEAVFGEYLDPESAGVDLSADSFGRLQENVNRRLIELDKVRADVAAGRIVDALQHPESIGAGRPTANRRTLDRLEATAGRPLRAVVCEALCHTGGGGKEPIWRAAVCLEEAALVLVSWARDIERWTADAGWETALDGSMDEVGALKASGYRARAIVELMERRELERWVRSATSLRAAGPDAVKAWALEQAADTPWLVPPDVAGRIGEALATDEGDQGFPAFVRQLSGKPPATGVDLRPRLWAELVGHAQRLGAAGRLRSPARERRPATVPFRILEQVVAQERLDGLMEAALAAVTRLVVPLQLVGPSENRIEFVQLSGRAPTPVQTRFKALLAQRRARTAREAERALSDADHRLADPALDAKELRAEDALRPSDKLCGDEMGNFAAFLSAKWRANDWMWGRMDAAATLVDLLVSPERLAIGAVDAEDAVRLAREAVTTAPPGMEHAEAWTAHFTETIWEQHRLEDQLRAALETNDVAVREAAAAALQQAVTTRLHEEVLAA